MENKLVPIEHNGVRVITTELLAQVYETSTDRIKQNFNRNKENFKEGVHYFLLQGDALRAFKDEVSFSDLVGKNASQLYLWTERGANRHCKILDTPKAWEQFDHLEETYFMVKDALAAANPNFTSLSPELQMFKAIFDSVAKTELKQKEQDRAIEAVNQKVDGIRDVVVLNPNSWREECRKLLAKVAQARGGGGAYQEVNAEVFQLVDERARVSLEIRLTNKRRRMADEGVCKSKRDKLNKVDVIADEAKLIEIYIAIVKEMAVKYGVSVGKGTEQAR